MFVCSVWVVKVRGVRRYLLVVCVGAALAGIAVTSPALRERSHCRCLGPVLDDAVARSPPLSGPASAGLDPHADWRGRRESWCWLDRQRLAGCQCPRFADRDWPSMDFRRRRITGGFASGGGGFPGGVPLCVRGTLPGAGGGEDVLLPPETVTVLNYRVRLAAPPWPGFKPTVDAFVHVPAIDPGASAHRSGSLRLRTIGRTGVRISLSLTRGATHAGSDPYPVVRRGVNVLIAGRTNPPLRGVRLEVTANSYHRSHARLHETRITIGSAATSSDGTFAISWHPTRHGIYMITAQLRHPGRRYLADSGCDLTLSVT